MSEKVKVSIRALEVRAQRFSHSQSSETMRKCRSDSRWHSDMGDYYFVDSSNNVTTRGWNLDDLTRWAREEGILKPFEVVE